MKQKEIIENAINDEVTEDIRKVEVDNMLLNKNIKNISLFLQVVLVMFVGITAIMSIFINEFLTVVEILLSVTLLIMAYNNYKIYRQKGLTCLYAIIGTVLLITSIFSYTERVFM